jgi:hypothetical protein
MYDVATSDTYRAFLLHGKVNLLHQIKYWIGSKWLTDI